MDQPLLHVAPPDDNTATDEAAPPPYSQEQPLPLLPMDCPPDGGAYALDGTNNSDLYHLDLPVDPPPYSSSETPAPSGYCDKETVLLSTNRLDVDIPEVVISPPPYERDQPPPYSK